MNVLSTRGGSDPSRLREHVLHALVYLLGAAFLLFRPPLTLQGWDYLNLAIGLVAMLWLQRQWIPLSRAVLTASGLALVSLWLHESGPAVLGRTIASSQAQLLGMCICTWVATTASLVQWMRGGVSVLASKVTWVALALGVSGLAMRWYESYQLGNGIGHVPISNLYEVFALFVVIVNATQLVLQRDDHLRRLAGFTGIVATAAAGFLVWYALNRNAHELQPLVPALDSYWMKLHVPANFIGYGAFCVAAMSSAAWLVAGTAFGQARLPSRALLEETSYRLIATGFVFFTIATILGSLWAAEAWGGYWSWDPKETWALIVWLNYASWLHLRLVKGYRGAFIAWWALVGLMVTLFAFLGVNIYLSGLHSYGSL